MAQQSTTSGSGREVIDCLAKACAYGDFEKLKAFLDADPAGVNRGDETGYFPLQWAALNNRVPEATFLLQRGALVNAADLTGQTALHWAAVRGSVAVLGVLLAAHADYELRDNRGYTVCHVAAQYGQTAILYHLALKWGVNVDTQDLDGRAPLHWAAYKGYPDTVRLLLVLDARYTLADREGCTPLHWAAIKGHGEACTVLLQGGSKTVLTYQDVTGSTPPQLAIEKGHRYLGLHLADSKLPSSDGGWCGRQCGPHSRLGWLVNTQLCPLIWAIVLGLLAMFLHKVMMVPVLPLSMLMQAWSLSVHLVCGVGLVFLYKTTTSNPGFIRAGGGTNLDIKWDRDKAELEHSLHHNGSDPTPLLHVSNQHKAIDSPALWAGHWTQLCVSCRIVRPLRAKHCSVTDRCIEVYDHYCPWVGNVIGKGNRHLFMTFLLLELYGLVVSTVVAVLQIRRAIHVEDWSTTGLVWMLGFVAGDVFMGLSVAALAVAQVSQVWRNVTTNELANWHRYSYLQDGKKGAFHNPFNHGCRANFFEAFHPEEVPMAPVFLPSGTLVGGVGVLEGNLPAPAAARLPQSSSNWSAASGVTHGSRGHVHGPDCTV